MIQRQCLFARVSVFRHHGGSDRAARLGPKAQGIFGYCRGVSLATVAGTVAEDRNPPRARSSLGWNPNLASPPTTNFSRSTDTTSYRYGFISTTGALGDSGSLRGHKYRWPRTFTTGVVMYTIRYCVVDLAVGFPGRRTDINRRSFKFIKKHDS